MRGGLRDCGYPRLVADPLIGAICFSFVSRADDGGSVVDGCRAFKRRKHGGRLVLAHLDDTTRPWNAPARWWRRSTLLPGRICPELPAAYVDAATCAGVLQHLLAAGHSGIVASDSGRAVGVMTAEVRENPVIGSYARLPAEGFAVDPDLDDPTAVVALVYRALAPPLVADGAQRHDNAHAAAVTPVLIGPAGGRRAAVPDTRSSRRKGIATYPRITPWSRFTN
jgi:hypothetical protein